MWLTSSKLHECSLVNHAGFMWICILIFSFSSAMMYSPDSEEDEEAEEEEEEHSQKL